MRVLIPMLVAAVLVLTPAFADPIKIKFIQPDVKKVDEDQSVSPSVSFSGWSLSIELTMQDELGIASEGLGEPPVFPLAGDTGFVIFADPDNCLVLDSMGSEPGSWSFPSGPGCFDDDFNLVVTESDETYFEFTVDADALGVHDTIGNPQRIAALAGAASGRPIINPESGIPSQIGPFTRQFEVIEDEPGPEIVDSYGYGADDDIPGLVVVARHGPGIVYEDNGLAAMPMTLRNLAGFANSVSYILNNGKTKTAINVQFTLPSYLIAPVVIADDDVFGPPGAPTVLWRVDGASQSQPAEDILGAPVATTFETGYPRLVGHSIYVVSAMAVSGVAPDQVVDMNGDNDIDHHDLELMGFEVLAKAKSVGFKTFPAQACHGGSGMNTVYADLDGNGGATAPLNCPAGSGSLSKPPR